MVLDNSESFSMNSMFGARIASIKSSMETTQINIEKKLITMQINVITIVTSSCSSFSITILLCRNLCLANQHTKIIIGNNINRNISVTITY